MFIAEISDLENEANELYHNHYFPLCLSDRALLNVEAESITFPLTSLQSLDQKQICISNFGRQLKKHVSTVEPSSTALGYHKYYLELTNFKLFPLKSIFLQTRLFLSIKFLMSLRRSTIVGVTV